MKRKYRYLAKIGIYLAAILILFYTVLPVLWIVFTSFKTKMEIYAYPPTLFPKIFTLGNYKVILSESQYGMYFLNSIWITLIATALVMSFAILSGYSFTSAFSYKGKSSLMIFIIIARMIPEIAIIIPMYFFIQNIGLFDTKTGIILMVSAMAYPLAAWLLKSFFDDIPVSLYDAARIDGCSSFSILRKIILPISGPSISSTLIITFLTIWNSFLIPLTFAKTIHTKTFPVAIAELAYGEYGVNWGSLSAISILAVIPMFLLGIFAQKYIIAGLTGGAEKG
ncbi:carbohydrate ABC transporter permease [Sediminispirochaeta smaragdinae]|uniref:Maltose/maltodextrin transport system permease protein MalG n=1 Tax=Sediminispirochaeta smaragdinae (strain DSM 11293 / JCM 15392 / SEBR 4228) TaxID=573413 RepID=E1RC61_SEDSS|nr:carbohydrate ABC transporter permease [Sediminispirochaeta smaragdinae]ADK79941.1 binding-protein-dependent transport systems inner membrane component [Sediminispirochaeta smaragdinae DSM 11293]